MSESKVIYSEDGKFAYFNGHKYHRTQNGYYERHELLHIAVMEEHIGKSITSGYVVHHNAKDENGNWDKSKNNIENLKCRITIDMLQKKKTPFVLCFGQNPIKAKEFSNEHYSTRNEVSSISFKVRISQWSSKSSKQISP